jgi:hypothetical protein
MYILVLVYYDDSYNQYLVVTNSYMESCTYLHTDDNDVYLDKSHTRGVKNLSSTCET